MTEPSSRRSGYARLLDRAIRIPAIRDHSEQEPWRKLAIPVISKNSPGALDVTPEELEQVAAWCIENRYPGNHHFVGRLITSRSHRGYGPARVRQELSQRGVACQDVEQAMRECDIDWMGLAREQAHRKYGKPSPSAFTEKVKIQRFLLCRGYLMKDIQEIWRSFTD